MTSQADIIGSIMEEMPLADVTALYARGATRSGLATALKRELVFRMAQGVVASADAMRHPRLEDAVACMTTGGIICHRTAGARHALTDDIPTEIEVLVPHRTRAVPPLRQPVRYVRSKRAASFEVGIGEELVLGVAVRMTGRARTVIDLMRGPVRQHGVAAVHTFLAEGGTGQELKDIADTFGVRDLVDPVVDGTLQAMSRSLSR